MDIDMNVRALVGSGDRIGLVTLPPRRGCWFEHRVPGGVHGRRSAGRWLGVLSVPVPSWSESSIGGGVCTSSRPRPRGELITNGPYAVVRAPSTPGRRSWSCRGLVSSLNTWLGAAIGIALYFASRMFAPAEEVELAQTFGGVWDAYTADEAALALTQHQARPGQVTERSTWPGIGSGPAGA